LEAEDLPLINAKIGLGRLDFEGYLDNEDSFSGWADQTVQGLVEEQDIAMDNDLSIQWETGGSQVMDVEATHCNFDGDDCYKARVIPVIFSISATEGYITGGQELYVTGNGFNFGDVVVDIDGVACEVIEKTNDDFTCLTGAADAASTTNVDTLGQYGATWEFYNETSYTPSAAAISAYSLTPYATKLLNSFEIPLDFEDYHGSYIKGWFIAPATTNYRFYLSCDDYCILNMGLNDVGTYNADDLTTVVEN